MAPRAGTHYVRPMKIALASDHAALALKTELAESGVNQEAEVGPAGR